MTTSIIVTTLTADAAKKSCKLLRVGYNESPYIKGPQTKGDTLIKAVFFDLGGTLLYGRGLGAPMDLGFKGAKAAYDRLKELGVSLPLYPVYMAKVTAAFMSMAGTAGGLKEIDLKQELSRLFAGMGASLDDGRLEEALAAWHGPFAAEMHLVHGAAETIGSLAARGLQLGVITNSVWPENLICQYLAGVKIGEFFKAVVSSANVGYRKPSPAIFEAALKRMNAVAADSVYVGDRRKEDVAGAQQVGMRSVLIVQHGAASEPGPEPDATIAALDALPGLLERLN